MSAADIICLVLIAAALVLAIIKVKKGKSVKITATPSIKGKKVTFTSSNKKIAKVTSKGKITGVKASSKAVKITVKCGKVKKTFKVKVTK